MLVLMEYCWIYVIFIGKKTQNRIRCWVKTPTPQSTKKKKKTNRYHTRIRFSVLTVRWMFYVYNNQQYLYFTIFFNHYMRNVFRPHMTCHITMLSLSTRSVQHTFLMLLTRNIRPCDFGRCARNNHFKYLCFFRTYTYILIRCVHSCISPYHTLTHSRRHGCARALTRVGGVFGLKNP